jgi:hypothetical protein
MTTLTIKGRIIFKETTVPAPANTDYSRWISTGHNHGGPEYSIQRFTFKTGNFYDKAREVKPYYRVYNYGFLIDDKDYPTFDKAAKRADKHYNTGALI